MEVLVRNLDEIEDLVLLFLERQVWRIGRVRTRYAAFFACLLFTNATQTTPATWMGTEPSPGPEVAETAPSSGKPATTWLPRSFRVRGTRRRGSCPTVASACRWPAAESSVRRSICTRPARQKKRADARARQRRTARGHRARAPHCRRAFWRLPRSRLSTRAP